MPQIAPPAKVTHDVYSRRRFLIGAGAIVLAAGAAVGADSQYRPGDRQRLLRALGLASSPDNHLHDSGAVETSGTLASRHTGRTMGWTISVPANGRGPEGIVYCLHGKGGDHRMAFDHIHVPDAAASVGVPVAVAAVDGGPDSYWHRRADGTDALAMLLDEFVPLVRSRVGALPQALMGWSMGGYGSLLAAERAPGQFEAVAPASPALWLAPGATAPGAFDGPADFRANDVFAGVGDLRGMTVAVACGTGDPFYNATQHLVALMDFPHQAVYGAGFHDDAYWRSAAPAQLRAIGIGLRIA